MTLKKSDLGLLEQMQAGNEKAFDKLFLKYYNSLCRFAYIYLKDEFASEEIIQELFINIWEQRDILKIQTSLISYLYTAAKNRALNYLQKGNTRKLHENSFAKERNAEVNEAHDTDTIQEIHLELARAVENLPQKCRQIFHLSRNEEKTNREIAEHLGISVKTVENQITIALKRIRVSLSKHIGSVLLILSSL